QFELGRFGPRAAAESAAAIHGGGRLLPGLKLRRSDRASASQVPGRGCAAAVHAIRGGRACETEIPASERVMRGSLLRVGVLVLAGAFGVACSSDDDGTGPRSGVVEIQVSGTRFSPSQVEITPGTTVRWVASEGGLTITPNDPSQEGVWQEVNVTQAGTALEH